MYRALWRDFQTSRCVHLGEGGVCRHAEPVIKKQFRSVEKTVTRVSAHAVGAVRRSCDLPSWPWTIFLCSDKDSDTTGLVVPVHHTWFTLDCSTTQDTHNMIVCSTCFFFFYSHVHGLFFFTGSYLEERQKRKVFAFT